MKAREGDLIKTVSNVVFDVKGLMHPPNKIIAFPRFIPSSTGTRQGKDTLYGKVYSLGERFQYLQKNLPHLIVFDPVFGETMCEVPESEISEHYKPAEKLAQIKTAKNRTKLEEKVLLLAETLQKEADIQWGSIGISGSILAGLTTTTSDLDPIVYGEANCRKAYASLQRLLKKEKSGFKEYTQKEMAELYAFRSKDTHMSAEDHAKTESRKAFEGKFLGTDYFVRFIKDWSEVGEQYGDLTYKNSGYVKVHAEIAQDKEALFTPCSYRLKNVQVLDGPELEGITEIASFRGRFCMQATVGEQVEAQGKAETVTCQRGSHIRLILGNKPEDYMILKA
jgi:predicted nucleotidyltransferase